MLKTFSAKAVYSFCFCLILYVFFKYKKKGMDMTDFLFGDGVFLGWIQLIPIAISLASTIIGGVKASKLQKQREKELAAQKAASAAYYGRELNTPELERTENAALLNVLNEQMQSQGRRNAKAAAVTGATAEQQLAAQDRSNRAYGNVVRDIAANASNRRTNTGLQKIRSDMGFYQIDDRQLAQRQQNWANWAKAGQSLSDGIGSYLGQNYDSLPQWMKWGKE
jgi:hypothetical protein